MKRTFATLLATLLILGPAQAGTSLTGITPPRAALLSDSDVSISYPNQVRLTSRSCGEFEIKFTVKNSNARSIVRLFDARGQQIGGYGFSPREPKGTAYIEYCKNRWRDRQGRVWPGFNGGVVTVQLIANVTSDPSTTTGRFRVTK